MMIFKYIHKGCCFSFPLGMEEEKRCLSCVPHTENYLLWQYFLENAVKIPSRVNFFLPRICSVLYMKAENGLSRLEHPAQCFLSSRELTNSLK